MSNKGRYVFDTNVIVSALLFELGNPSKAFRYALQHGEILLSLALLEELSDVLGQKKFVTTQALDLDYKISQALPMAFVACIEAPEKLKILNKDAIH